MVVAQAVLSDMLARRRDRAISVILNMKEKECDSYLPRDSSQRLRKVVLDQMNELVDFAMDLCNSLDTGEVVLNEDYLKKLDEVHEIVVPRRNGHSNGELR
jgi:hypothetical protein